MPENPWREAILDRAVYTFVQENEGAEVVRRGNTNAVVVTGGMTEEQRAAHRRMVRWTLGLWWIVLVPVALLRRPQNWLITVNGEGVVEIRELG